MNLGRVVGQSLRRDVSSYYTGPIAGGFRRSDYYQISEDYYDNE